MGMIRRTSLALALAPATLLVWIGPGCGSSSNPAGPTPEPCAYALSAASQNFTSGGGSGSVTIATDAGCAWSVVGAAGWLALTSAASGAGPGIVAFTVSPNTTAAPRERSLTIATQPFRVTQEAPSACTFSVAPEQIAVDDPGGARNVMVQTATGCAWNAASGAAWIAVTGGASGTGPGTVTLLVGENNSTAGRTGIVTVAGRSVTIEQAGEPAQPPPPLDCSYSVSPVEFVLHWHGTPTGGSEIRVTTGNQCEWTAASGASWIGIASGASGTGSGTIRVDAGEYLPETTRRGAVEVRWPTPTQGQNVWIAQEGCRYALVPATATLPAAGGTGLANVTASPVTLSCPVGCPWTAETDASWLRITTATTGAGDAVLKYEALANGTGSERTGRIRVHDLTLTVTQPAP